MLSNRRQLGADLRKPGDYEKHRYFRGLAGGSLIARYSARDYQPPTPYVYDVGFQTCAGYYRTKGFLPLGLYSADGPLIRAIRPLLAHVQKIIEPHDFWSWFTVIRIGYRRPELLYTRSNADHEYCDTHSAEKLHRFAPAVFLLNVKYGTTFEEVGPLVQAVHAFFQGHGIKIDVEVRENEWDMHGASMSAKDDTKPATQSAETVDDIFSDIQVERFMQYDLLFSTDVITNAQALRSNLGWEMSLAEGESEYHSTAGVLFELEGKAGLFAAASKHTVPPSVSPGTKIVRGASRRVANLIEEVNGAIAGLAERSSRDEMRGQDWIDQNIEQREFLAQLLAALRSLHDDNMKRICQLRVVGAIHAIDTAANSDIAVVSINKSRLLNASNTIWMSRHEYVQLSTALSTPLPLYEKKQKEEWQSRLWDLKFSMQLSGEIFSIQDDTPTRLGIPQAAYLHRGAASGLQVGRPNSVEACVRDKETGESSWQIAIVACPNPFLSHNGEGSPRFSCKGDSGSAVMDENGKYIGFVLGGGAVQRENAWDWPNECDVTFVTPADRHLEGLKRCLGREPGLFRR